MPVALTPKRVRGGTYKTCPQCGLRYGPVDHLRRKFCSVRCKGIAGRGVATALKGRRMPERDRARVGMCPCGKEFRATKDTKTRRQKYCGHTCYLRFRGTSIFEQDVALALAARGVPLLRQQRIGRWTIDFVVSGTKIAIEADGDYWHSIPGVPERDQRKDRALADLGYLLLRIKECAFRLDPEKTIDVTLDRFATLTDLDPVRHDGVYWSALTRQRG